MRKFSRSTRLLAVLCALALTMLACSFGAPDELSVRDLSARPGLNFDKNRPAAEMAVNDASAAEPAKNKDKNKPGKDQSGDEAAFSLPPTDAAPGAAPAEAPVEAPTATPQAGTPAASDGTATVTPTPTLSPTPTLTPTATTPGDTYPGPGNPTATSGAYPAP